MTVYEEGIVIRPETAAMIKRYLTEELPEEEALNETETISYTARFANGYEMDIKCCGVKYLEGESNRAWLEAVLFDENGAQLCCEDPYDDESIVGTWEIEYNGDIYRVFVEASAYRAFDLESEPR